MKNVFLGAGAASLILLSGCVTTGEPVAPTGYFQECIAQSSLMAEGNQLTQDDISRARADRRDAERLASTVLGQVNAVQGYENANTAQVIAGLAGAISFYPAGYSAESVGWYNRLRDAEPETAALLMAYEDNDQFRSNTGTLDDGTLANRLGLLRLSERGVVNLAAGRQGCADAVFEIADRLNEEEIAQNRNSLEGYERVMVRNLWATSLLLNGDTRAQNVTQSARALQEYERSRYDEEIEAALVEAGQVGGRHGQQIQRTGLMDTLSRAFDQNADLRRDALAAESVTSPYLNPLGDYLSAVVAEMEASSSMAASDGWDRAANAWSDAADLLPNSSFLVEAEADARRRQQIAADDDTKIVHVLVGVGVAPYKQIATLQVPLNDATFPIMLPVMRTQPTDIHRTSAAVGDQAVNLQLVADVEGMLIRHNRDNRPAQLLGALLRGYAAYAVQREAQQAVGDGDWRSMLAGAVAGAFVQTALTPSTDSWMSLPKGYYAARFVVPADANELTIATRDPAGRVLHRTTFPLLSDEPNFVFAIAQDDAILGSSQARPYGETAPVPPAAPIFR